MITYQESNTPNPNAVFNLYNDANWSAYTKDIDTLMDAIKNSLHVLTAWDGDKLVGLIRLVGDGKTIIYIQDILVLKAYKQNKIGSTLVKKTLDNYKNVRQIVLLTDDTSETRSFYENLGFESCDKGQLVSFAKFR
ncbi:MAG: GNAT family N-acetyltransferase [Vicingaceae bacterium]|nr:GNAT family N-acetyltransferase [Vicingaceae bacterium]